MTRQITAATLAAAFVLCACAQNPAMVAGSALREAGPSEVMACTYLTDIQMTPGVYGPLLQQGLARARNKVKADAMQAGANTVVFDQAAPGAQVYLVHAKAYRC
ncbi:hypothetical protein V8J36_12110 [Frigidibacter sp. MR17.14]|uniref:hypothetical protein n=1 Tax=Frigidibacter sp. MR17.14 TaxID=3126509 RepID=UPI00301307FC